MNEEKCKIEDETLEKEKKKKEIAKVKKILKGDEKVILATPFKEIN